METITARWIFPVNGPPLPGGTVTIDDERIAAVEPRVRTPDIDLGNVAIVPGLVNAHTHLDLTGMRGLAPPSPDFVGWLKQVTAYRRARSADQVPDDIRAGLDESIRSGTTLLGDIAAEGRSWEILAGSPVRAVVYREMIGLAGSSTPIWLGVLRWLREHPDTPTCRAGLSPHAPYSINAALIRTVAWNGYRMAIHLAESAAELELLEHRSGPFVPFLQGLGVWAPENLAPSPDWILQRTRRSQAVIYAHGNYLRPNAPIPPNGTIVYCPRTHAAFGHPPHPFREFLARGVRVAVGTDSLASNPDLDVLAEIRFLHRQYPDMPGADLLRMATLSGAEALGWADETGSLAPGKSMDLAVVPLPDADDADPYRLLLGSDAPVSATMCRGRWIHGPNADPPSAP